MLVFLAFLFIYFFAVVGWSSILRTQFGVKSLAAGLFYNLPLIVLCIFVQAHL